MFWITILKKISDGQIMLRSGHKGVLIAKEKLILGFLAHAREENVPSTAMSSIWKSTN